MTLVPAPTAPSTGQNVFCPMNYGAAGDGVTNDGPAIRACLVAARAWACPTVESRRFNIPVVDLAGRCYATDIQIEVPGGQGMVIQNGVLKAGTRFDASLYLLHIGSTADAAMADGFRNVNTTLRNLYFDANHVGGCLFVERFMRLGIDRCLFAHYATVGLKTAPAGSHEMFVTNCQFGEYWWGETDGVGYDHPDRFVGTGIEVDAPDNHFSNIVVQLSKIGIKVNEQANMFNQIHIWTGYVKDPTTVAGPTAALRYLSTGLWITQKASMCSFDQLYVDGCEVLWENPWKTSITNSLFLQGYGDANRAFIRFKPMRAGAFATGVVIADNAFQVQADGVMKMIAIDTSAGTFNAGQVTSCRIDANNFTGVHERKYTTVQAASSSSAAHTWTFDFSGLLAFGDVIQEVKLTHQSAQTTIFRVARISGAVVTVSSYDPLSPANLEACTATVWLEVTTNQRDVAVPVKTLP
jgi:hypothetical protein